MNIIDVRDAVHLAGPGRRQAGDGQSDLFSRHGVGDQVSLDVVRRIDGGNYLVSFGGEQHVMESSIPLDVGARVRAVVIGIGDRLSLRYVDAVSERQGSATALEKVAATERSLLASLESRY